MTTHNHADLSAANARQLRPHGPFHLPPGARPINATAELIIEATHIAPTIVLTDRRRAYTWRVAMSPAGDNRWSAQILLPQDPTIIDYYFEIEWESGAQKVMEQRQIEGENKPVYGEWEEKPFKIAVYDPKRMPAAWTQGMVMYQIFADRFARSDYDKPLEHPGVYGLEARFMRWDDLPEAPPMGRDFYGGDLRGIIDKLDYIKSLGVECIYLNPIFHAASNHRYEAIDFMKIDPMLGTEADFDELVREAHAREIRIILDAVFNHCSSDSIYFDITGKYRDQGIVGAYQSKESPYFRWFNFRRWPTDYDGWVGFGFMPEFVECPEMEAYFVDGPNSVTAYWLRKGIDGWRADVAFDNTERFWQRYRRSADAIRPDAYHVSEEWRDSTHYLLGDTFSATMNYRFTWAMRGFASYSQLKPSELDDRLMTWIRDTPEPALYAQMNLLDSHDTDRLMNACSGDVARYRQTVALQMAYPGAVSVYYGSEVGIEGRYAEDGRRPMPWEQAEQGGDLMDFYRQIIAVRRSSEALRRGEVETVLIDDERLLYGFARRHGDVVVYAIYNGGEHTSHLELPVSESGTFTDLLDGIGANALKSVTVQDGTLRFDLPSRGFLWLTQG